MGILHITRAVRQGSHVIIGMYGESGSGKTYSAIQLARGLVGPQGNVCLLDTENGRGRIYASEAGGYDYAELTEPFTPERYIEAIKEVEDAGYQCLIIDSASHEWEGIGGVLEQADESRKKIGNKGLLNWVDPKSRHKRFVQALLRTKMHLILCLRAKEKMVEVVKNGKKEIVSAGYVSVQDKRFIFDVTVQIRMLNDPDKRGHYVLEKCPGDLLGAFTANGSGTSASPLSVSTGVAISEWVAGGEPVDHDMQRLRHLGEAAASGGIKMLRKWWDSLSKEDRIRIKPYVDGNLKSIADTADAEEAAAQEQADSLEDVEAATFGEAKAT